MKGNFIVENRNNKVINFLFKFFNIILLSFCIINVYMVFKDIKQKKEIKKHENTLIEIIQG